MRSSKHRDEQKSATDRVGRLFIRRRKFRARLPIDPDVLYKAVLGLREHELMTYLLYDGKLSFHMSSTLEVRFPKSRFSTYEDEAYYKCKAALKTPMPTLRVLIHYEHPVYEELLQWAQRWTEAHKQLNEAVNTVHNVIGVCRTPSEVVRLWPKLGKFLYPQVRRPARMGTRMKLLYSRLMADEDLQRRMVVIEEQIAEALLLPDNELERELAYLD